MSAGSYSGSRFRAALLHYVLGRGANALASITLFVLLARALDVRSYGSYVAVWALMELLLAIGNLGTDWVSTTELPRLRQGQAWSTMRRLVRAVLATQLLSFGSLAVLLVVGGPMLANWLGVSAAPAEIWPWIALSLLAEGLGRSLRDQMLSSLLLQWLAQAVQLLRNLIVLTVAFLLHGGHGLELLQLLRVEAVASAASALLAWANLHWHLRHPDAGAAMSLDARRLRQTALHAWLGSLGALLISPQVLLLLASRSLGAEATALLGFARNLAEQVRRFMPIEFGFSLLRTYLVSRQKEGGDGSALVTRSQVAWKLNLLILLPVWICAWIWGDALAELVGGGKFANAGLLLACWLSWVLIWSHHRLSDSFAHLLGRSDAVGKASLLLSPLPLLWLALLPRTEALWSVLLLVVAELFYSLLVSRIALAHAGLRYPWASLRPWRWLAVTALTGAVAGFLLRDLLVIWGGLAVTALAWGLAWLCGAVSRVDLRNWQLADAGRMENS
jgi:O-antigen/teichoic acid export membrane protein